MAEGGTAAQVIVRQICETCDSGADASWFCVDCDQKLCDRCKFSHLKGKKTSNDEIVTIKEARTELRPKTVLCGRHQALVCEFYCNDCDVSICKLCLDADHKRHDWKMVKDVLPEILSSIDKLSVELEKHIDQHDTNFKAAGDAHVRFLSNADETENEVKTRELQLQQEVADLKNDYLTKLSKLRENENKKYSERCNEYQTSTTPAKNLIQKYQTEKITGNLDALKQIKIEMQGILRTPVAQESTKVCPPVFTQAEYTSSLLRQVFGSLDTSSAGVFVKQKQPDPIKQGRTFETHLDNRNKKPWRGFDAFKKGRSMGNKEERPNNKNRKPLQLNVSFQVRNPRTKTIHDSKLVTRICPDMTGGAWLVFGKVVETENFVGNTIRKVVPDIFLTHVDQKGEVTHLSKSLGGSVNGVGMDKQGQLFVAFHSQVVKLSTFGDNVGVFTSINGEITALCVAPDGRHVYVSFRKSLSSVEYKTTILTLDSSGLATNTSVYKENHFHCLTDLSVLSSGELVALVRTDFTKSDVVVVVFDKNGTIRNKWGGATWGTRLFQPQFITIGINDTLFITQENNIYSIHGDGSGAALMDGKALGIGDNITSITGDSWGRLWVGSPRGWLYILELDLMTFD